MTTTPQRPLIYSGLLALAFSLVYVGRLLVGLLAEPLKLDLGLNDTQLGLLTGLSFGIVYALTILPMARLADRVNRSFLIMAMLVLFGFSTIAIGMAYSFLLIVILRLIIGACEAAMFPASISLVADSYSEERRHLAMTVYTFGIVMGLSLLVAAVGYFEQWNGWRSAFIMVGLSGVVVGLLVKLLFRDARTPNEGHHQQPVIPVIKSLFRNPAFVHLTLGMTLYLVVDNVSLAWAPAFLARSHERSPQWTSNFIAVGAGLLNGVTVLASGPLLARLRQPAVVLFVIMGLFTGLFVIGCLLSGLWLASVVLACAMGLSATITAILLSTIQSLAPANARATASALVLAPGVLFGAGGGPQIAGLLSDLLTPRFGAEALRYSILIVISIAGIWACVHFVALLGAIGGDRKLQESRGTRDPRSEPRRTLAVHEPTPPPPRVRLLVASIGPVTLGVKMRERSGSIRTSIQGQSGSPVAAAGERSAGSGVAGDGHRDQDVVAVVDAIAVHARPRAGMDCGLAAGGGDRHSGAAGSREERVVPRERRVFSRVRPVSAHQPHAQTASASRMLERELRRKDRALAETAALLVLSKKVEAIFSKNRGEEE